MEDLSCSFIGDISVFVEVSDGKRIVVGERGVG